MKISQLIDRLLVLKDNQGDVDILIVEHGFAQGAVQTYIRNMEEWDLAFESNLQNKDLVFPEPGLESGIVIGIIPQYVTKTTEEEKSGN